MEYLVKSISINMLITLTPFLLMKTVDAVLHFQPINEQELYVTKGVDLKINCLYSLTEEISSKVNCPEIFWQWNERRFENRNKSISQCLSILHIEQVWWKGKQIFFCMYKGYTNNREVVENKSLVIISGEKPKHVPQPSIRWIEDVVEITWIPNRDNNTMTGTNYAVEYFVPPENVQNIKTILPNFCGVSPLNNCSHRIEYYCRASFPSLLMTTYNVKLVAENKFGRMAGKNMKVIIPLLQQKMAIKPAKDLRVFLTKSGVGMKWSGSSQTERKKVWYKCQGSSIIHNNFTNSESFAISKDKLRAFTYCRFCVSRQKYGGGQFSCYKCKVIKTAEDIPNEVPELKSCQNNSCPFVPFGIYKNVTISWRLPNKRSWNGIISRQLIFYYEENERRLKNITIRDSNVTEWTLDKLKIDKGYHVFMVICTGAGCSRKSNVIHITGSVESSVSFEFPFFSDKANTGLVVGLTLGILALCFVFIFVFLYIKRHEGVTLPPIQEPQVATGTEQESNQQSPPQEAEYDLLEWRNSAEL
jgi:hypothetical protein